MPSLTSPVSSLPKLRPLVSLIFLCVLSLDLRAQSPELTGATPLAVRPGATTTVSWQGINLQNPLALWTAFGATNEWAPPASGKDGKPVPPDNKKLVSRLSVPAAAPLGVGLVRVATGNGLSTPFFFLVDDLPVMERARGNDSPAKAQALKLPIAVEGNTEAGRADYFQFELQAGERVSIEVFAARLLTKCDPTLRLLDAKGAELAFADDTPGLGGDCWLGHRATASGPVILEVRDAAWLGGGDRRYHVRIGDFPLVATAFPPAGAPSVTVEGEAFGSSAGGSNITSTGPSFTAAGAVAGGPPALRGGATSAGTGFKATTSIIPGETVSVPVRFAAGKPAGFVPVRAETLPIHLKKKPNNTLPPAALVRAPVAIYGKLDRPGDRDGFRLAVKKGERFTLTPITRSLGSPAMLYLAVEDEKGALLAANDTANTQPITEIPVTFRAPADGECRIIIGELAHRGGPGFTYGLRVEPGDAGFDLTVTGDRFVVALGGSFTTKVTAQRRSVTGPITLALASGDGQPLPAGFTVEHHVIEQGKNDTQLKVTAPDNLPLGSIFHVALVGRGLDGTNEISVLARQPAPNPANAKDPSLPLLALPSIPRLLRETVAVCVGAKAPDFFAIHVPGGPVGLAKLVGKGVFVVSQKPVAKDFTSLVKLSFEGLPKDITIAVQTPKPTKTGVASFRCDITGPAEALTGDQTFTLVATAEHKGATQELRLTNIVLRAVEPLGIDAKPAGPLTRGGKQKLHLTITRYGEATNALPVVVRLPKLPTGVTGPESLTIAANQTEAELELTAAATVAPGKLAGLVVSAATQVKGQDVKVESTAVVFEVVDAKP